MPLAPAVIVRREFLMYKSANRYAENPQLVIHPRGLVGKRGHFSNEGFHVLDLRMDKSDAYPTGVPRTATILSHKSMRLSTQARRLP
jgi:hypothetical protein